MTRMRAHTAFFLAAACATAAPPPELSDARNSYARAEQGPAQKYKPDQLHEAQVSLDQAEKNFKEHGADERTKTLAYVASRKARLADVNGATEQLIDEKKQASNQMAEQAAAGLERYKKEADDTREKLEAAKIAYRQESRGTIITMPGNVTFRSGKATLLPFAASKLDQVAEALRTNPDQEVTVEGYTDSKGSSAKNQELSQRRASSVRDYLVAHGIPSERVKAVGQGNSNPIATNMTPEGRAQNRRVEIVLQSTTSPARRSAREPPLP